MCANKRVELVAGHQEGPERQEWLQKEEYFCGVNSMKGVSQMVFVTLPVEVEEVWPFQVPVSTWKAILVLVKTQINKIWLILGLRACPPVWQHFPTLFSESTFSTKLPSVRMVKSQRHMWRCFRHRKQRAAQFPPFCLEVSLLDWVSVACWNTSCLYVPHFQPTDKTFWLRKRFMLHTSFVACVHVALTGGFRGSLQHAAW